MRDSISFPYAEDDALVSLIGDGFLYSIVRSGHYKIKSRPGELFPHRRVLGIIVRSESGWDCFIYSKRYNLKLDAGSRSFQRLNEARKWARAELRRREILMTNESKRLRLKLRMSERKKT